MADLILRKGSNPPPFRHKLTGAEDYAGLTFTLRFYLPGNTQAALSVAGQLVEDEDGSWAEFDLTKEHTDLLALITYPYVVEVEGPDVHDVIGDGAVVILPMIAPESESE